MTPSADTDAGTGHDRYVGARVRLVAGRARLQPPVLAPASMVAGRFSVLSPGTERRHLAGGVSRDAGYMTLGRGSDAEGWTLAPVPHGAAFDPTHPGAVTAPPGVPATVAAVARFQQLAVIGLARVPPYTTLHGTVIVGSGPVALGCALELLRRGAIGMRVITTRRHPAIASVPGVRCAPWLHGTHPGDSGLVIDAAGTPERAAALLGPGGTLGLLGTPPRTAAVTALGAHRGGWTVIGMHELAPAPPGYYQDAYTTAATWLAERFTPGQLSAWCRIVPGAEAPEIYRLLGSPGRPAEPVILFDWEAQ